MGRRGHREKGDTCVHYIGGCFFILLCFFRIFVFLFALFLRIFVDKLEGCGICLCTCFTVKMPLGEGFPRRNMADGQRA